jgi:signal transduction histidine kinase
MIDLVSLVPSRTYHPQGVDLNYGAPAEFKISVIDEKGNKGASVIHENSSGPLTRKGHPYTYQLEEPVLASGIHIEVIRLTDPPLDDDNHLVLSWAEIFCFSGNDNVAENADVSYSYSDPAGDTWSWRRQLLVDGQTPLGLPESKTPVTEIGWTSGSHETSDENSWIELDLEAMQAIDAVRLYPALRPSLDNEPGFGIPLRFEIKVADTPAGPFRTVFDNTDTDFENPGHNPVTLRFPATRSRVVRLEASRLWKPFSHYPAFLALSEMEVLNKGRNLAHGAKVSVPETTDPIIAHASLLWSPQSLTNGAGPKGLLLQTRNWIEQLDQRFQLETQLYQLQLEEQSILDSWSRRVFTITIFFGLIGLIITVVLPAIFKVRESRRLRKMRGSIAGDLHDEVGSNLGSIQMLAELMRDDHPSVRDEATTIERVAAETVNSVRDIVWLLRPQNTETAHTVEHLRDSAAILLDPLEWHLETDLHNNDILLSHEDRRNLLLFFREALHNISKHARAKSVTISISSSQKMHRMSITDDGIGMSPQIHSLPHSLRALKERALRLHAKLRIESDLGEGTTIILDFPRKRK